MKISFTINYLYFLNKFKLFRRILTSIVLFINSERLCFIKLKKA